MSKRNKSTEVQATNEELKEILAILLPKGYNKMKSFAK